MISRTPSRVVSLLLVLNTLLALLGWLLSGPGWRLVAAEAHRRIVKALGPAKSYRIEIDASWWDLLGGHMEGESIQARDVHMKDGLVVDKLDIELRGLTISGGALTRLDRLSFKAVISEDALNAYLPIRPKRYRLEPQVVLVLTPDNVEVRVALLLGVSKRVKSGKLSIAPDDDTRLQFEFELGGQRRELGVLSLGDHPMGIHLLQFRVVEHALEVEGVARPALPLPLKILEASPSPTASEAP